MPISMKNIPKKLSGSALLVTLFILSGIFIVAFGAGYLSFFNTKNTDTYQQSARARLAAETGVERMKWEMIHNNFDLYSVCSATSTGIFATELADSSYYLKCDLDLSGKPQVQAVGVYKNISVVLNTGFCYDVETECDSSCAIGSLCGGGVLFSSDPLMVSAPSGIVDTSGNGGDNSFLYPDTLSLAFDDSVTPSSTSATDENDGRINTALLVGTNYQGADFCSNLSINNMSDWYLPAKSELNKLLRNSNSCTQNTQGPAPLYCEHATSISSIVGGFSSSTPYLSSTENDIDTFFSQDFINGTQATSTKSTNLFVRCLRRPL